MKEKEDITDLFEINRFKKVKYINILEAEIYFMFYLIYSN